MNLDPIIFDVRYRFEYWDGKADNIGKWNHSGDHIANQAWCVDKNGLSWVFIEAKNIFSGELRKVVECPGQDFRFFQWRAIKGVSLKNVSAPTPTINVALVMWTLNKKISVYRFGKIDVEDLNEHEMKSNFSAYGR